MKKCMDMTWVCKSITLFLIVFFVYLNCGCSGDDSCGYEIIGYVRNAADTVPLTDVKASIISYDLGKYDKGTGSSSFTTNSSGMFSFEILLTPQHAYYCPEANEIEYRFKYEKPDFFTVDTTFAKGTITYGGTGERNKTILNLPTVYLKPL